MAYWLVQFSCLGVAIAFLVQPETDKHVKEDKLLIMKIQESVDKKIAIEKIEEFVGKKATINTMHRSDMNAWSIVRITLDPKKSQVKSLRNSIHAVYWIRKTNSPDVEAVGVIWTKKKEMKIFFGKVLDP